MTDRLRSAKRIPLLVLAALFLLRALIPAGYMPGNLLDGEFVRLCPVGLPEGAFGELHAGHSGHGAHSDTGAAEADASCPAGIILSAVAFVPPSLAHDLPAALPLPTPAEPSIAVRSFIRANARARAPPA